MIMNHHYYSGIASLHQDVQAMVRNAQRTDDLDNELQLARFCREIAEAANASAVEFEHAHNSRMNAEAKEKALADDKFPTTAAKQLAEFRARALIAEDKQDAMMATMRGHQLVEAIGQQIAAVTRKPEVVPMTPENEPTQGEVDVAGDGEVIH